MLLKARQINLSPKSGKSAYEKVSIREEIIKVAHTGKMFHLVFQRSNGAVDGVSGVTGCSMNNGPEFKSGRTVSVYIPAP